MQELKVTLNPDGHTVTVSLIIGQTGDPEDIKRWRGGKIPDCVGEHLIETAIEDAGDLLGIDENGIALSPDFIDGDFTKIPEAA